VQDLLGHANISITLDTYSHVIPGMGNQTVSAMEEVFG
jgi:integrase